MKTNPINYKVNGKLYAYILESICPENVDVEPNALSVEDKIRLVLNTFNTEYNYTNNKLRIPNLTSRFEEWMRGLPSVFCVAFADYDIAQIGKAWGCCETEKETAKFVNNWWGVIADKFFQFARILEVNYTYLL